jgi:hypothetical protein
VVPLKKLVLVLSLLAFSSAALACHEKEDSTAKKENKSPAVAKAAKKPAKAEVKKGEKKS